MRSLLLIVALGVALGPSLLRAGDQPSEPVVKIEILADPEIEGSLVELVELEVGRPLAAEAVARTLSNFVAAGVAHRVEVRSEPIEGGRLVRVVAFADPRIVAIDFEGDLGLDRRRLERFTEVEEGDRLVENRVVRSVFAMQDALIAEGFPEAKVRVAVDLDPAGRDARLKWRVDAGARARVRTIEVAGELGDWTAERLLEVVALEPGDVARARAVDRLAEDLQEALVAKGYPEATASLVSQRRDGSSVDLELDVKLGRRLVIEVEGSSLSDLERRRLLPFSRERWEPSLVTEAETAIRRSYQSRGYWRVVVDSEVERTDSALKVRIRVEPGEIWSVRDVHFEGNATVSPDLLRPLVATAARRAFVPGSGRLIESELAADRANLLSYYRLQGWLDAEVGTPRVIEDEVARALEVVFPIVEGVRRRIVRIEVLGAEPCGLELEDLRSRAGGPWHPLLVDESEAAIRAACEQAGYADALIGRRESWNEARTLVDLAWSVDPGQRSTIDRLVLRGVRVSEPDFVLRASGLEPGQALSRQALLAAERRLFRLGVFSEVNVTPAPGLASGGRRDVLVQVREGRTRRVTYGVGYDSEDGIGALFGFTHSHVAGRGYQLQLDLRASEATSRFRLIARRPETGRRNPFGLSTTLFAEEEERPAFTVDRRGGRVEVTRSWGTLAAAVGVDYRRVDLLELARVEDPDRDLLDIEIASVIGRVTLDRRDDPLDPTRGGSTSVVVQQAFPLWNAEEEFLKVFAQQTFHLPLDRFGTLAASFRIGGIEPADDEREIPIAERLYAGGRTTHRAFPRDRLGILGSTLDPEGAPLGGNGLLLLNLDWRFPLFGAVGGIVFADGGNVYPSWRDLDPAEIRWGAGVGVRYLSPVGPLRLEIGWPFDPAAIEDEYVVSFSFGNAF